jgi:hypothetical protein
MLKLIFAFFIGLIFLAANAKNFIQISPKEALEIGVKVWYNESAGRISGLTTWNAGENFASLGIGHFIWYPYGKAHVYSESFPTLLRYMQNRGVTIPQWLEGNGSPTCPWKNREEFMAAQDSPQMIELRQFLLHTLPIQAQFMINRMEHSLPIMLMSVPPEERPYIQSQFYRIAGTPLGIYALVDYVNFKGVGVTPDENYDDRGWGLLEVLENMKFAPEKMTELQAFVWAANQVLTRRVMNSSPYRHDWQWLDGWRNRLQTYLG